MFQPYILNLYVLDSNLFIYSISYSLNLFLFTGRERRSSFSQNRFHRHQPCRVCGGRPLNPTLHPSALRPKSSSGQLNFASHPQHHPQGRRHHLSEVSKGWWIVSLGDAGLQIELSTIQIPSHPNSDGDIRPIWILTPISYRRFWIWSIFD